MRDDMFKVIVERPRRGWRSAPRYRGRLAGEDDLPVKIGLRRHVAVTRQKTKWFNENLNPLKRFFRSRVGHRWDDVYSEIAATLAPGHTVKEHVRQHIGDLVALHIKIGKDGTLVNHDHRHWFVPCPPWRERFYVDPRDGVLKESLTLWRSLGIDPYPWRRRKPKPDPDVCRLEPMRDLRRIAGIWYEVHFDKDPLALRWVFDLIERKLVPAATRHAVFKRQLSGLELKTHGLTNDFYN